MKAQSITTNLWRYSISTRIGATFTNRLTISNHSQQTQTLLVGIEVPATVQLLSALPEKLLIRPGEAVMVPVKGLVYRQAETVTSSIYIRLSDLSGNLIQTVPFYLTITQRSQLALSFYHPEETIVLFSGTEQARLSLQLVHNRAYREKFSIEAVSMPEGLNRTNFPLHINLAPRQDTTLHVVVSPGRYWSSNTPYQLVLTIRDSTGSVMGNVLYTMVVASASKRYVSTDGVMLREGYGASVAVTKLSDRQWAREGRVWGTDSVGKAQMDFQVHYLDYVGNTYQQLQNSFISFRADQASVRLGSLYDYHELPLLGRGLKVNVSRGNRQWTVWAVNTNPNWLNSSANAWMRHIVSARYDQELAAVPNGSWSLSSSYYSQPGTMRAGYLNFAAFQFSEPNRHSLSVLGGQSVEFARQGTDRARTFGWAGQLNYSYQRPRFNWQLRSYVSSPVYTGLQRGATLINSQLVWEASTRTSVVTRFSHVRYNQIWFTSPVDRYRILFGNSVVEINLNQRLHRFVLSLRPYYYAQTDYLLPFGQKADAYRLAPSIAYQRRTSQRVNLTYDAGAFYNRTPSASPTRIWSQRIVGSAVMGPFSVWGYWQKGPYYLTDLRNDKPGELITASVAPMVDFSLLNRRLIGSVGLNYLYDALYSGSRCMAIGRVRCDVTPSLWVRLEGNATPYSQQSQVGFSQYRLEVAKRFDQLTVKRRGQLRLSFFEDVNGNGLKETGEQWMDSLLVTVNDNTLLTNGRGTITYQNLPPGTYTISAISADRLGDPVQYFEKITIAGSVKRIIPIRRTFRISGQLRCQMNAYDRQPCQFNRFFIDVRREQEKVASTTPLPNGTFSLHLPPGKYTMLVNDYGRNPQVTIKTTTFTVSETGQQPVFDWTVDASTRPVEIKRFTTSGTDATKSPEQTRSKTAAGKD